MGHEARLRLFAAVYPPAEITRRVLALLPRDLPAHRLTAPEQVHVTVHFIGPAPVKELDSICASVARAAGGLSAAELCVRSLITLPRRGRARLVAAALDEAPTLMELQRRLASRLSKSPRARPGDRFTPHMTLCRFDRSARAAPMDVAVGEELCFAMTEVVLMKSVLQAQGAEHSVVERFGLG